MSALRDSTPYRVTDVRAELFILTDDAQLARLVAGEKIPLSQRKVRRASSGDIVRDLPAKSVPNLLLAGWIEPAPDTPAAAEEGASA